MKTVSALGAAVLYARCDEASFAFETTIELAPLDTLIGQDRAAEALALALAMRNDGYNTFVMGQEGAGKHTFVRRVLDAHARTEPLPDDLCYVNDFANATRPRALTFPAGRGRAFRADMKALVDGLRIALRAAFDSDDYRSRRQVLEHEVQERHDRALEDIQRESHERGVAFIRTPTGFAFAPALGGEILSPEVFGKLAVEEQERSRQSISDMERKLATVLAQLPRMQRDALERIRKLNGEVVDFAAKPLFDEHSARYADLDKVSAWLSEVRAEIADRAEMFFVEEDAETFFVEEDAEPPNQIPLALGEANAPWSEGRYAVNLLVDRAEAQGAPVVYEDHPTLENLVGRIEHRVQLGNLVTDFTLIQPGALHLANGGHLLIDARKILAQPQAYDALKRAIRSRQVRIENLADNLGLSPAGRLSPEPFPLDVKVVLIGDRHLYYLLCAYDPDFAQLFKVAADFSDDIPRTPEAEQAFARMLAGVVSREKLAPLHRSAVARAIEHASRLCEDAGRLTMHMQSLIDLLRESDYFAHLAASEVVRREHVQRAIDAQARRADRIREESLRKLSEGVQLLTTRGVEVGQVNGLSVLSLGNFAFGRPMRITCRVRIGRGEVLDIEREVRLGGPLHSKGVLILTGFLGARYAHDRPLSLSASLVFEQSYGGVEGDSASLAEACALLSAIAQVPLAQRFALTGSINQLGEVQPIGGVNEKIEGFFDACREQGLTSEQAVIVPAANVRHLMLRADVVEAVRAGKFAIYAVRHVDEALALLSGLEMGEPGPDGTYPEGTFHARVHARLRALNERARQWSGPTVEKSIESPQPPVVPGPAWPGPGKDAGDEP